MKQPRRPLMPPNTLLCFSPPVMIATVIIEVGLAIWIVFRYKLTPELRLIVLILLCLAGFQLAEFNVCGQYGNVSLWSLGGYILITMLPALGLDLIARLLGSRSRLVVLAYGVAGLFAGLFAIVPNTLNQHVCTGNYVIFMLGQPLDTAWNYYYMAFVLLGTVLAAFGTRHAPKPHQSALLWLAVGYLSFTVPSFVIYKVAPAIKLGLPSIMCGFAVIFALIIGLKIAPLLQKPRRLFGLFG